MAVDKNSVPELVDPAWIAARLDDPALRLIEIDVSAANYNGGHIPGALLWNAYADLRRPDYLPVADPELESLLRKSGIAAATAVVFYGYGAHLGHWLLRAHDHRAVHLMDGPRERWTDAGHAWSLEQPQFEPSDYALVGRSADAASKEEVRAMIESGGTVIDTRSKAEYDGERFWPSAAPSAGRSGHVPGAIHVPIELLRGEDGSFRSVEEMLCVLRDRGVDPRMRVVTYCTIGNRAAQAWFAMRRLLGFEDVGVYYGSWTEWGTAADTPIEGPTAAWAS